jgi:hypothetical protein
VGAVVIETRGEGTLTSVAWLSKAVARKQYDIHQHELSQSMMWRD